MATLDTHAIARSLTDAGAEPKLADAITAAVRQVADRDTDALATKADLNALEARIAWRFIGALVAIASIQTAILIAVFRGLGS